MKHYIDYLNKDKGFKQDREYFDTWEQAMDWGKANLENFNIDMIHIIF